MGAFSKGDVVLADLPYSDLSGVKRRPLLVLAAPSGLNLIVCMITSRVRDDGYDVPITDKDMAIGKLLRDSSIRPGQLFALDERIISQKVGALKKAKTEAAINLAVDILKNK